MIKLLIVIYLIAGMQTKPSPKKSSVHPGQCVRQEETRSGLQGKQAPEAILQLTDGSRVELSSLIEKKVVVLYFWTSWCGPCRRGLQDLQQIADDLSDQDVAFYTINLHERIEAIDTAKKTLGLSLPVALDDGTLRDTFQATQIPQGVVIGKDGIIHFEPAEYSDGFTDRLKDQISTLLTKKNEINTH